eukprot:5407526-Prorocentrum_lima.AAC.1
MVAGSSRSGSCKLRRQYQGTAVGWVGAPVSAATWNVHLEDLAPVWWGLSGSCRCAFGIL